MTSPSDRHNQLLARLLATPLVLWGVACTGDDKGGTEGSTTNESSDSMTQCVAAGTPVATPRGWVPVETLAVGDAIYAVDLASGLLVATAITAITRARRECLALLADDGRELIATPDHPVHVPELDGYAEAGRVALGQAQSLTLIEGRLPEVRIRQRGVGKHRTFAGVHDVFDITVASELHNFVAGGFVVHNKSSTTTIGDSTSGSDTVSGSSGTGSSSGSSGSTDATSSGSSGDTSTSGGETSGSSSGTTSGALTFPCGQELTCEVASEYCEIFHPGQPDAMITYMCKALPDACLDAVDCTCLMEQNVFGECMPSPEGGLVVSIFAP